jgi:hypothetical protein
MLRQRAEEMMADYAHGEDSLTLPAPDDLKRIEGIGHKISSLLQEAGASTFAQLTATGISDLKGILTRPVCSEPIRPTLRSGCSASTGGRDPADQPGAENIRRDLDLRDQKG